MTHQVQSSSVKIYSTVQHLGRGQCNLAVTILRQLKWVTAWPVLKAALLALRSYHCVQSNDDNFLH